jgi:hypothetical protein
MFRIAEVQRSAVGGSVGRVYLLALWWISSFVDNGRRGWSVQSWQQSNQASPKLRFGLIDAYF